jgi:tRNA A37 threonylcarbamoyltransferase TsaD
MAKEITREEAVERLVHHLRGHLLAAMIREYREPYTLSLFVKASETKMRQEIAAVLDAFKLPAGGTSPPPPPKRA